MSNYIHYKEWDEITYHFPNFNNEVVVVWEYFLSRFTGDVIIFHAGIEVNPFW